MRHPFPTALRRALSRALALGLLAVAPACDGGPEPAPDVVADPGTAPDVPARDPSDAPDGAAPDAPPVDDGSFVDDHGFRVRVPAARRVPVEGPGGQTGWAEARDRDWMCTFDVDGVAGTVYVQDRPLKDRGWIQGGITWRTDGAWWSRDGVVTPVDALYDSGGNHLNDWLDVVIDGVRWRYYHSSFTIAWRKCQAMDCLQQVSPAGAVLRDGCRSDRSLPAWCVEVAPDGTVPPLVDAFAPCPPDAPYG